LGGRVVKNVAGFDLLRPVVGSRGRLGVITSVCLRAFPVPAVDRLLVLRAEQVEALRDVARAVRTAPIMPASCVVWAPATSVGGGAALLVRLQGALPTVEADRATLEAHAGVRFEEPQDSAAVALEVREHGTHGEIDLTVSVLPSRLFDGLAAARARLGEIAVAADAYNGLARLAAPTSDVAAVEGLRRDVEALGGALTVVLPGGEPGRADLGSRPSPDEVSLAGKLEKVFDPSGVFWPCRA